MLNPPTLRLDAWLVPISGLTETLSIVNRAVLVGVKANVIVQAEATKRSWYVPFALTAVPV